MARYSSGFKARMVQRMAGPEGVSAFALSKEVGVAQPTLSRWLKNSRNLSGMSKKKQPQQSRAERRTAEEKYRLVQASEGLTGEDFGAFLRREGIHESQLLEWREKAARAATEALKGIKKKKSEQTPEARRIRDLERELRRKEKALAETAALLVLKKKLESYYEGEEYNTDTRSET